MQQKKVFQLFPGYWKNYGCLSECKWNMEHFNTDEDVDKVADEKQSFNWRKMIRVLSANKE